MHKIYHPKPFNYQHQNHNSSGAPKRIGPNDYNIAGALSSFPKSIHDAKNQYNIEPRRPNQRGVKSLSQCRSGAVLQNNGVKIRPQVKTDDAKTNSVKINPQQLDSKIRAEKRKEESEKFRKCLADTRAKVKSLNSKSGLGNSVTIEIKNKRNPIDHEQQPSLQSGCFFNDVSCDSKITIKKDKNNTTTANDDETGCDWLPEAPGGIRF